MPAWLLPAALTAGQMGLQALFGNWGANRQQDANMEIAKFQALQNEKYLRMQQAYDHPMQQMRRFKQAGLNPHLVYGQGSPGNQGSPLRYPEIRPADYQSSMNMAGSLPLANQTAMTLAQVQATNAKTVQTTVLTDLNRLQTEVLKKNPLLNDEGFKATIESLKSSAAIKAAQAGIQQNMLTWQPVIQQNATVKVQREIELLNQRFDLNVQDAAIKAEILKSKEFQNAILEIQKKFMADGEVGPAQFYQLIQLILSKAL